MTQIHIYDTTLRDGARARAYPFSLEDKLKIAQRLDEIGIHYIEGGWPGSNAKDATSSAAIRSCRSARRRSRRSARRGAPASQCEADPQVAVLLDAETPVVTIVGKSWDLHVQHVLETTLEENLAMIGDTCAICKAQGRHVFYDAEHFFDGYQGQPGLCPGVPRRGRRPRAPSSSSCATPTAARCPWEVEDVVRGGRLRWPQRAAEREVAAPVQTRHPHARRRRARAWRMRWPRCAPACTQVQGTHQRLSASGWATATCARSIPNLQLKLGVSLPGGRASLAAPDGAVALRRRDGEPGAQPAAALRRRERVRAQGRHPRGRGDEGGAQLPAHRPNPGRQRAAACWSASCRAAATWSTRRRSSAWTRARRRCSRCWPRSRSWRIAASTSRARRRRWR